MADDEDRHDGADDAPHSERAKVFGNWVLATFADVLAHAASNNTSGAGSSVNDSRSAADDATRGALATRRQGVLDVAGGKGELSLHLTLAGQRCTLVDPRPTSGHLSKWQRKLLRRSGHGAFQVSRELFGAAGGETGIALARQAALVLAMHPDEVTEEIVDAAISARTPFAVVPCCVFSRLFPSRRRADGRPVTTHPDLCKYLQRKHPNACLASLPFAGKNTVVYCVDYDEQPSEKECAPCDLEPEVDGLVDVPRT